jgi:hypothetical protein
MFFCSDPNLDKSLQTSLIMQIKTLTKVYLVIFKKSPYHSHSIIHGLMHQNRQFVKIIVNFNFLTLQLLTLNDLKPLKSFIKKNQ